MKLAEALLLRSEKQNKIDSLKSRIKQYVKIQEGDTPPENPNELLDKLMKAEEDMVELITKINHRNAETKLPNGKTIAEALIYRDMVMKKRGFLHSLSEIVSEYDYRMTHTEVRTVISMDMADIQKQIDALSKEFREIDTMIQSINWTTDL